MKMVIDQYCLSLPAPGGRAGPRLGGGQADHRPPLLAWAAHRTLSVELLDNMNIGHSIRDTQYARRLNVWVFCRVNSVWYIPQINTLFLRVFTREGELMYWKLCWRCRHAFIIIFIFFIFILIFIYLFNRVKSSLTFFGNKLIDIISKNDTENVSTSEEE